jgi:hypothetical protein
VGTWLFQTDHFCSFDCGNSCAERSEFYAPYPATLHRVEKHLGETEEQVARLEKVFKLFGKEAEGKNCPAIVGIIEEGKEIIDGYKGSPAFEAGLGRDPGLCLVARAIQLELLQQVVRRRSHAAASRLVWHGQVSGQFEAPVWRLDHGPAADLALPIARRFGRSLMLNLRLVCFDPKRRSNLPNNAT